ncbi:MAG: hypothetical protein EP343_18460 [Deltaproteobacteria bacterium]|nr:MAG: hypothetical protein EP343_18460 [Deltaproteobacteria bacterium]
MMNNETFENLLLDYVEGTLPDDVVAAMKRHAEAHPDCAASLDALEGDMRFSRTVFSKDRWAEPPSSLDRSILQQAEQAVYDKVPERPVVEEHETLSWWARLLAIPSFQPVLAFCTVTLLVGGLWLASRGKHLPSLMQPKENASYKAESPSVKSSPKLAQRRLDANDRFAGNIESGDQTRTVAARKAPPPVGQRWKGKVSKTAKNADPAPPRRTVSPVTGKLADSTPGAKSTDAKAATALNEGADKKEKDLLKDEPTLKRSLPRRRARYRRTRRASRALKRRRKSRVRRSGERKKKDKKAKREKSLDELLQRRLQQVRRLAKPPSAEPSAPPRRPVVAKPSRRVAIPRIPAPVRDNEDDDDVDTEANRPAPRRRVALAPAPLEPTPRPKPQPRREFKPKPRRRAPKTLNFDFQNRRRRARGYSTGSSTGYRPSQRYVYPTKKKVMQSAKPGRYVQRKFQVQARRPAFGGKGALGRAQYNQGLFYRSNQRLYLDKAIANYQSALKKAQRQKDQARVRTILLSMIRLYVRALQPHLAEQYVRDYVATFPSQQRASAFRNVAQAYLQSGDAQNSQRWLRRSRRARRLPAGGAKPARKAQPTQKASPR